MDAILSQRELRREQAYFPLNCRREYTPLLPLLLVCAPCGACYACCDGHAALVLLGSMAAGSYACRLALCRAAASSPSANPGKQKHTVNPSHLLPLCRYNFVSNAISNQGEESKEANTGQVTTPGNIP